MREHGFARFFARLTACHMVTYFVAGAFAFFVFDYATWFRSEHLACFMRPVDSTWVAVGPGLQWIRGLIFAAALLRPARPGVPVARHAPVRAAPPRVALLEVEAGSAEARYILDGQPLPASGPRARIDLTPNVAHELEVDAPGYVPVHRTVSAQAGETVVLGVLMMRAPEPSPSARPKRARRERAREPSLDHFTLKRPF